MANTYSQIFIQVIFATKGRDVAIANIWEEKLFQYITGTIQNKGQKMLAINGTQNHIHFLIGMKPDCCLSDLVREIKKTSNEFISNQKFSRAKFAWQEGFGAFSYSRSQIDQVIKYIMNQKIHHRMRTFREEYLDFMKKYEVEYNEKYLFEWYED